MDEKQFRSLNNGRGIGVVAIFGREKAEEIMAKISELAEDRGKIAGKEGTEGRGLRQFVADTAKLLTSQNPTDEEIANYCNRVNERVFKGYKKAKEYKNDNDAQQIINSAFWGVEDKSKVGEFSSIPPMALNRLWNIILKKE